MPFFKERVEEHVENCTSADIFDEHCLEFGNPHRQSASGYVGGQRKEK